MVRLRLLLIAGCAVVALCRPATAADPAGAAIYAAQCAACHGVRGEGTVDVPEPLTGDRPLADLVRVVTETMPDGAPEDCVGQDAELVAAYIYDAFYSEIAQARNAPARIEPARLTVSQYENAVADLLASFGPPPNRDKIASDRGIKGTYFKKRVVGNQDRVFARIDERIDFDFGADGPDAGKGLGKEYAVSWTGAVVAPQTGDYEFVIETPNGFQFWLNDKTPRIDGIVASGNMTQHRCTVRLLGGRAYPLRLEWYKSPRDAVGFLRLKWVTPGGVPTLIPPRNLTPIEPPEVFVVATPFPPDDRSTGYIRGTSISKAWDEATTNAALEVGDFVVVNLKSLADVKADAGDRPAKLWDFCRRFVERAFRRPLTADERNFFVDRQFIAAGNLETAVMRVVLLALKSPRFLFREVGAAGPDDFVRASRLSFALWDSLPDRELRQAAEQGKVRTPEQVRSQAQRLARDPRAWAKLRDFLHLWLQLDRVHGLSKDAERYPGFDEQIAADLRTSLDLFLEDVVHTGTADFRTLLQDETLYLNGRLAKFYGVDLPGDADFQRVSLDAAQRAGVLTHPYLMAGFGYHAASSPIHRGVFLTRSVLGRRLKPPPQAFTPAAPDMHPGLSTRERTALQTSAAQCMSCHATINGLGFTLENFDTVGRFRGDEVGEPIDASGSWLTRDGQTVNFTGARQLAAFLAGSEEVSEAFAEKLFQHAIKQPVQAYGPDELATLRRSFVGNGYNIQSLLIEVAVTAALRDAPTP